MANPVLELFVEDSGSLDGWFPLQRSDGKLWLHSDTFAKRTVTIKRSTVSNVYIPGTYTVRAVQDNATETVAVFIRSDDPDEGEAIADYLTELFTRPSFTIMSVKGNRTQLMTGQAADFSKDTTREYMHSGVILMVFSVPVLPNRRTV